MKKSYVVSLKAKDDHPLKELINGILDVRIPFDQEGIEDEKDAKKTALSYVKYPKKWTVVDIVIESKVSDKK